MARFLRAVVHIPSDSAESRDQALNTFHFHTTAPGAGASEVTDVVNALLGFYTAIDGWLSVNTSTPARIKVYDLEDPPERLPIHDSAGLILTPGAGALPNEVATCLSYRSDNVSGINRRRNRGRIFIGPLDVAASLDAVGDTEPHDGMRNDFLNAADTWLMHPAPTLSGSPIWWSVFSRADALGLPVGAPPPAGEPTYTAAQLDAGFRTISHIWCDNAFDTQRRRGKRPTSRFTRNFV